jgi:SAM-dependent methyltransferase
VTPEQGDVQEREREFHDRVYESGEYRERPANRFYQAAAAGFDRYDDLLEASVDDGTEVLELGCGEGVYGVRLARLGGNVTGIDISDIAVRHASASAAEAGLAEKTTFRVMDCEALELPDQSFDLACGEGVLHHVDLEKTFAEIARVLRPQGRGVFLEPMGHNRLINLYRRLTPAQRTEDEHPLLESDLELAGRHFGRVETEFFTLLSLAAMPLRRIGAFTRVREALDRADQAVFRRMPSTRRQAWIVVMRLSEPR